MSANQNDPDRRLHTAVLVRPAREKRRIRRRRAKAAARLHATDRAHVRAERKRLMETERAERRNTDYLPAAGEPRRAALRSYRPLRVPAHQDTTAVLSGAYPFLAEGGLGSQGVFVGHDMYSGGSFVFDPWQLYSAGVITAPNESPVSLRGGRPGADWQG